MLSIYLCVFCILKYERGCYIVKHKVRIILNRKRQIGDRENFVFIFLKRGKRQDAIFVYE